MKTIFQKISIVICVMVLATYSKCLASTIGDDDDDITRTFNVTGFNAITNRTVCRVHIIQTSGEYYMRAKGQEDKVNRLEVSVNDNKELVISMERDEEHKSTNGVKIDITIGMPQVNSILLSGVGDITSDKLTGHQIQLTLKGVGKISIGDLKEESTSISFSGVGNLEVEALNTKDIVVYSKGVGDIHLSGTAQKAEYNVSGVSSVYADKLKADQVTALCRGVGSIYCHATNSITADLRGTGNIKYTGSPKETNLNKTGLGHIKQE